MRKCHLNLIEALAELNVPRYLIDKNKEGYDEAQEKYLKGAPADQKLLAKKIQEFDRDNLFLNFLVKEIHQPISQSLGEILNTAKHSYKISVQIVNVIGWNKNQLWIFAPNSNHYKEGPYFQLIIKGLGCPSGCLSDYMPASSEWGGKYSFGLAFRKKARRFNYYSHKKYRTPISHSTRSKGSAIRRENFIGSFVLRTLYKKGYGKD